MTRITFNNIPCNSLPIVPTPHKSLQDVTRKKVAEWFDLYLSSNIINHLASINERSLNVVHLDIDKELAKYKGSFISLVSYKYKDSVERECYKIALSLNDLKLLKVLVSYSFSKNPSSSRYSIKDLIENELERRIEASSKGMELVDLFGVLS